MQGHEEASATLSPVTNGFSVVGRVATTVRERLDEFESLVLVHVRLGASGEVDVQTTRLEPVTSQTAADS